MNHHDIITILTIVCPLAAVLLIPAARCASQVLSSLRKKGIFCRFGIHADRVEERHDILRWDRCPKCDHHFDTKKGKK